MQHTYLCTDIVHIHIIFVDLYTYNYRIFLPWQYTAILLELLLQELLGLLLVAS